MIAPREFWETCRSNYAHLKPSWEFDDKMDRTTRLKEAFLDHMDLKGKIVIDYGCGGGFLGKFLFREYGIAKYIAIDIAKRSLRKAWEVNRKSDCEYILVPVEFSTLGADVFISIACMQHFPSEEYLNEFLENLNNSNVKAIALQIKYGDETEFFGTYDRKGYGVNCRTNAKYISSFLTNYNFRDIGRHNYLVWESKW